jgi:myo-inositol-1(or 4)-monophosphatase
MTATNTALAADWLGICRRAATELERLLGGVPDAEQRAVETGSRGAGGDRTLVLDRDAEDIVFAELERLHDDGWSFSAVSEERGAREFGGGPVRVVIDPIDGSLNAKRDGSHYALSVAVADGPTMADVAFGFVHDFGAREQWWAQRGSGAWRAGCPGAGPADGQAIRLDAGRGERRSYDGTLEIVGLETADPGSVRARVEDLVPIAHRLRVLGTIAVSLCSVAAARFDGMVTLGRSRGVDAAAGQLIVREAGGLVSFPDSPQPLGAPLDAEPSSRLVAARSPAGLRALERVGA